jgi:hypothetical protein
MSHDNALQYIYKLYVMRGGQPLRAVELNLTNDDLLPLSRVDLQRNEPQLFSALCQNEDQLAGLRRLYDGLLADLKTSDEAGREHVLDALQFVQGVVATALWKYQQSPGDDLETFARTFDRLDIASERHRLYQLALKR